MITKLNYKNVGEKLVIEAYVAGLVASDGNIICKKRTCKIKIITSSIGFAKRIAGMISSMNKCGKVRVYKHPRRNIFEVYCYSKNFAEELIVKYGLRQGKKASLIAFPSIEKKLMIWFIRGLFDGDSSVTMVKTVLVKKGRRYEYLLPRVTYKSKSYELILGLYKFLKELDFKPRLWRDGDLYVIAIEGFKEIKKFVSKIGYLHPEKLHKVASTLENTLHYVYYGAGGRRRGSA